MDYDLILRLINSFFTGALLSIGGSSIQIFSHNSMASTSTLGIDAFVIFVLLLFQVAEYLFGLYIPKSLILICIVFIAYMVYLFFPAKQREKFSNKIENLGDKIVLIGLSLNLLVGSLLSLLQFASISFNFKFSSAIWFGHFKNPGAYTGILLVNLYIIFLLLIRANKKQLFYYNFGQDQIYNLKLNAPNLIKIFFLLIVVTQATLGLYFGVFSFLGLIFPHFLRSFSIFNQDTNRELILGSLVAGLVLMLIDTVCYFLPIRGVEIPVGVLISFIGSWYLVFYFFKKYFATNSAQ